MANLPCAKCGALKWWWRDDAGCSQCVPSADDDRRTKTKR